MSPSTTTAVDKRGFFFVLPPLGMPDLKGDYLVVKAAIGLKEDVLLPLVESDIGSLPLRQYGKDDALDGLDCRGSPTLFKVIAKREMPHEVEGLRLKLPPECDWFRLPIDAYTSKKNGNASSAAPAEERPELKGYYTVEWGTTAELTPDQTPWWEREEKVEGEMSEWDVLMRKNMFTAGWCEQVYADKIREEMQRGRIIDGAKLKIHQRMHPAKDGDFRRLDYIVVTQDDVIRHTAANTPFPEDKWKLLPLEAMKPGAYRHYINIVRREAGKKIFSREEWPPALVS